MPHPDFTTEDEETGQVIYWEHLGMMRVPACRRRWERKLVWYREQGIPPWDEGSGPNGTLFITQDDERGGIDVAKIEELVDEVLGY